jgi:hypothetical protein
MPAGDFAIDMGTGGDPCVVENVKVITDGTAVRMRTAESRLLNSYIEADETGVRLEAGLVWITENEIYAYGGPAIDDPSSSTETIGWIQENVLYGDGAIDVHQHNDLWIERNYMTSGDSAVDVVRIRGGQRVHLTDNWIDGGLAGVHIEDPTSPATDANWEIWVEGNTIADTGEQGILVESPGGAGGDIAPYSLRIAGNNLRGCGVDIVSYASQAAIEIIGDDTDTDPTDTDTGNNPPPIHIHDNTIDTALTLDGMRLTGVKGALVHDNYVEQPDGHGYVFDACSGCTIHDNKAWWPNSDDTYDAFLLAGDSNNNYLHSNDAKNADPGSGSPERWQYGVNVSAAACDDNIVVGNDLRAAGDFGTAPINDAGTGTILTWPADATYGDNFV